jgi:hypothetical protein
MNERAARYDAPRRLFFASATGIEKPRSFPIVASVVSLARHRFNKVIIQIDTE